MPRKKIYPVHISRMYAHSLVKLWKSKLWRLVTCVNLRCWQTAMWSETVGLRTRPIWDQTKSVLVLVLVLQVWYCFVKSDLGTLVVITILKDTATFQVQLIVSLFCAWNITTVEIKNGVHLAYSKLKPAKCLCLLPVVSSWSRSCHFGLALGLASSGLGLGLVTLVLILVLVLRICSCFCTVLNPLVGGLLNVDP